MDVTVLPHLDETLGFRKIPPVPVLEHEEPPLGDQSRLPNQIRQGLQTRVSVRGIGKHELVLGHGPAEKCKGIATDDADAVQTEVAGLLLDVTARTGVLLDGRHADGTPARQFIGHRSRSGEQIEGLETVQFQTRAQQVEQAFAAEVRGRSSLEMAGWRKPPPLEAASDYAHRINWMRGRNCWRWRPVTFPKAGMKRP